MENTFPLEELARRVSDALSAAGVDQSNGQVSPVPDARTLRYYTTLGLLDRPIPHGRRAHYDDRHVRQAVAVKKLQAEGLALGEIQQRLAGGARPSRRAGHAEFWKAAPAAPGAPASTTRPRLSVQVPLGRGVTITVPADRLPSPAEVAALAAAATPLLEKAAALGLQDEETGEHR